MTANMSDDIIIITAARPGLWMKEKLTPSAWKRMVMESEMFGEPGYGETMDKLRDVDDRMHQWTKDLDSLIKEIKKAKKSKQLDAGRMVDIVRLLAKINYRLEWISNIGKPLEIANEKYLKQFQEEVIEDVTGKVATAGFLDDFWAALKKEWLAEKILTPAEKRRNKERKRAVLSLIGTAEQALNSVKYNLKQMEDARASGDVGKYVEHLQEISTLQQNFESEYNAVYMKHLHEISKDVVEKHQKMDEEQTESEMAPTVPLDDDPDTEAKESPPTAVDSGVHDPTQKSPEAQPPASSLKETEEDPSDTEVDPTRRDVAEQTQISPGVKLEPGYGKEWAPGMRIQVEDPESQEPGTDPEPIEPGPFTEMSPEGVGASGAKSEDLMSQKQPKPEPRWVSSRNPRTGLMESVLKMQHQRFVGELVKAAKTYNDPYILAAMLAKYSGQIEDADPEASMKLLAIVEGIVDE